MVALIQSNHCTTGRFFSLTLSVLANCHRFASYVNLTLRLKISPCQNIECGEFEQSQRRFVSSFVNLLSDAHRYCLKNALIAISIIFPCK